MQIYIHRDQQEFGPYLKEELLEQMRQGALSQHDYARTEGMAEYTSVGEILRQLNATEASSNAAARQTMPNRSAAAPIRITSADVPPPKRHPILAGSVAIAVIAAGLYVTYSPGAAEFRQILAALAGQVLGHAPTQTVAAATPTPPPQIVAIPEVPEEPPIEEVPPPVEVLTPPAPAQTFDPSKLAENPAAWPKVVRLKENAVFPAVLDGRQVGSVKVPAGTSVNLVNLSGEKLTVDFQGGQIILSWDKTNLEEAASEAALLVAANPTPTPTPTPASPAPTTAAAGPTSANWMWKQPGPNYKADASVDISSMLESGALEAALRKAKYQLTPPVITAYLRFSKAKALRQITNSQLRIPADFLAWIDSDPIVAQTVYGSRKDAAGILCVLRSLEIDLGRDAVRKNYTQLALAMAVAEAGKGADADLNPRNPLKLVIGGDPRRPVDTHAKGRTLDQNDHIINFLEDHPPIDGDTFGPNERPPELKYDSKGIAIIEGKKSDSKEVTKVKRGLLAADVIASRALQLEFNAYMEKHHQPARIDCGDGVLVPNQHEMIKDPYAAPIKKAYEMFRAAYEAKGRLPASRDPFATPAERCAFIIRNDSNFPSGGKGRKEWHRFPVKTAPWPTMTLLALANEPLREREEIWQRFVGTGETITYGEYIGGIAQQFDFQSARRLSPYAFTYGTFQMMMKDGGVCGTMANMGVRTSTALGTPACTAGQPGHCALILFEKDKKGDFFQCHGGQYASAEDDGTHPHAKWVFADTDDRRDMIWHQSVAYGVNAGFKSYLDSMVALQIYKNLPKGAEKSDEFALVRSGLAANPYNLALVEVAANIDDGKKGRAELVGTLKQDFERHAKTPGCPTKPLYVNTVAQIFEKQGISFPVDAKQSAAQASNSK